MSTSPTYYQFGPSWIEETRDGDDILRRQFTADPRVDPSATLDSVIRVFADGSHQTTWHLADGTQRTDPREY